MMQSENGTEYVNHRFDSQFKGCGISRRLTIPNNPEQNGVAERKNRTLGETARCLLIQKLCRQLIILGMVASETQ